MSTKIFGLSELPVGTIGDTIKVDSNSIVPEPVLQEVPNGMLENEVKQVFKAKI